MQNNLLLLIVAFVILYVLFCNLKQREPFNPLYPPQRGRFNNCYRIRYKPVCKTINQCKYACDKMDSCAGMSYNNRLNDCRLYSDASLLYWDPNYTSWTKGGFTLDPHVL